MNVKHVVVGTAASLMLAIAAMAQPYGIGPGAGRGGFGMGPGMMGGYGGPGVDRSGPGMMWGFGADPYAGLNLSAEQLQKIAEIREEAGKAMWQLMGTMRQERYQMHGMVGPGGLDEQGARKSYDQMAATQKAMFDLRLDSRSKIDAVLTNEQREQLRARHVR